MSIATPTGWPFEAYLPPTHFWIHEGIECAYVERSYSQFGRIPELPLDAPEYVRNMYNERWYCGYVRVPEDHPWWVMFKDYNDLPVEVHGGITFGPEHRIFDPDMYDWMRSAGMPPEMIESLANSSLSKDRFVPWEQQGGWIGFDTHHAHDDGLWMAEMVVAEVEQLAKQVLAAK